MPPQPTTYDTKKILLIGMMLLVILGIIGFLVFKKIQQAGEDSSGRNLFPFDGTVTTSQTGTDTSGTSTIPNPILDTSLTSTTGERLRPITNYAVTSFIPFLVDRTETEPKIDEKTGITKTISRVVPTNMVRFNAKQNGFLVDAEVTKNIITISQKTNTPIPNSEELWLANSGNSAIYRSWDEARKTISTFSGSLPSLTALNYCQKPFTTVLGLKSKGDEVKELQKYINAKLSINLTIDGIYGKKISNAIKPLQKILLIPETGKYDKTLIDAINLDCTNIVATKKQEFSGLQKLTGDFLPTGILRGSVAPSGNQLFTIRPSGDGVVGVVSTLLGRGERTIFKSPLTEWKPEWVTDSLITLTTLASSEADGYLYSLNPTNGNFQKILGPLRGLTTLANPLGTKIAVSYSDGKSVALATYDTGQGILNSLDLKTFSAKCTWQDTITLVCAVPQKISSGQYPDDWYQGNVQFNDAFWKINTEQRSTVNLFTPTQLFDAHTLKVSPDGAYLYFINKIDGTLWSYRLTD